MAELKINDVANKAKLYIQQGSELTLTFDLSNFTTSLVSATGRGQIRRSVASTTVEGSFTCVVDSGASTMTATLTAAVSSSWTLLPSNQSERVNTIWCYDIELVFSTGVPIRLLWGECEIIPEVTR